MVDDVIAAVTLPGAIAVVHIIAAAVINAQDVRRRDPVRRFTRQQRRAGMARAGGVCEMETGFGRRCNRAKGARIPSPSQQLRLERRRRTYVPPDGAVAVGERQPLP